MGILEELFRAVEEAKLSEAQFECIVEQAEYRHYLESRED